MSKKTETIEIRVSPELKAQLADQARATGTTMSGYLRDRIAAGDGVGFATPAGGLHMSKTTKTLTRMGLATLPVAAVAAFYMVSGTSMAVANPDLRVTFAAMDLNGDGAVTAQEYSDFLSGEMAIVEDPAEDDTIPAACRAEFAAMMGVGRDVLREEVELTMKESDVNGDGAITFDEVEGAYMRDQAESFLELDHNEDGYITEEDLVAVFQSDETLDDVVAAEDDATKLSAACEAALAVEEMAMEADALLDETGAEAESVDVAHEARLMIAEFDSDRDGRLSLSEYIAH